MPGSAPVPASSTPRPVRRGGCPPRRRRGRHLRLRHHAVRRHAPRPRGHLPGLRHPHPRVARRRLPRCATCRTHRRRRPAPRARDRHRRRLARPRAASRSTCSAATWKRSASSRPTTIVAVTEVIRAGRRTPCAVACSSATSPTASTTTCYFDSRARHPQVSAWTSGEESRLRPRDDARALRRARGRPRTARQARPARPAALARGPRGRALVGDCTSARGDRAGTSSAR